MMCGDCGCGPSEMSKADWIDMLERKKEHMQTELKYLENEIKKARAKKEKE